MLVIGQGLIGRKREAALIALGERLPVRVAATVDPVDPVVERPLPHHSSLAEVAPDAYDAAVVAVPHDVAGSLALRVLASSRPILLEKPLGVTAPEAEAIACAAAAVERPSFVGYNYRYLPTVRRLFEVVGSGRLGRLRNIDLMIGHGGHPGSAEGWKLDPARAGGGVLLDPGVHLLDLLLLLAPELRCRDAVASGGFWGTGIEEDLVATFDHAELIATVRVSHIRWVNTFRIEVGGEDGYAIIDGRGGTYGPQTLRLGRRWAWREAGGAPQRATEEVHVFDTVDDSLLAELEAVVAAWSAPDRASARAQDHPHPATMAEALQVSHLCEQMYGQIRAAPTPAS